MWFHHGTGQHQTRGADDQEFADTHESQNLLHVYPRLRAALGDVVRAVNNSRHHARAQFDQADDHRTGNNRSVWLTQSQREPRHESDR